ncbi:MAG TPA: MFS transporter [Ktedonobacterales bacterium]|nr:MFS transporter [Ktedonobacterales bacterium]
MRLSTEPPEAPAASRPVPLWRNRDYLLLFSGQMVSNAGSQVSLLAFPLLVLFLTHSPAQAGVIGALRGLPYFLLGLPAGALVDRWDRKRVMLLCDSGRALALGSVPLAYALGVLTIGQLYAVSLIEGTLYIFFSLAETASLPRVVAKEQLTEALAQDQASFAISELCGPALAGILYGIGRVVPFLIDALSYVVSVISLFCIKRAFQEERATPPGSLRAEIAEGLRWLWRQPLIRFLAFLVGGLNLTGVGYPLIIIVLAQGQHADAFAIGLILACAGVGNVLGTLVTGPIQRRVPFAWLVILMTWALALTWPLFVFAPDPLTLGIVTFLCMLPVPVLMVAQFSYRMALIPDHLQGRVNSVFRLVVWGCQPLGLALTGALLQAFGPVATVWILFVPQVALSVITMFTSSVYHAPD